VAIANLEQRPARVNRDKKRRPCDQLLIVQVSRVNPWWIAADAPGDIWWGDAHAAEKWVKRNIDSGSKIRDHAFRIQGDGSRSCVRVIIWQEAAARCEGVQCIRNCQLDLLDSDFQDVS